ncbi:MAG: hypothetical protein V2I33_02895 [Kangiellaceae bacterium]|jgi:hypothetical protein|nr:hypothetical protein [Kangiellaceae bacterium]
MRLFLLLVIASSLALIGCSDQPEQFKQIDEFIAQQEIDKSKDGWKRQLAKPPLMKFDTSDSYVWNLSTNLGLVKILLMPDVAPMHVSSTIYLTRLGSAIMIRLFFIE